MKKYDILKVLGISFLVLIVLSWIIPAGSYSSGNYASSGTLPYGLFDFTRIPLIAVTNLIQYSIVLLVIGGLYGVLNKTGVYTNFVESIAKKFKGKEKNFLIVSIIVFATLQSVSGATFAILILVPFFVAVTMLLGFDKISAMLSTIGAMLLGALASTFGSEIVGTIIQYFSLKYLNEIWAKVILFIMLTVLYILFVRNHSKVIEIKKDEKQKKETKKVELKESTKKASAKKTTKKTVETKTTKAETKNKKVVTIKKNSEKEIEQNHVDIPLYNPLLKDSKKSFIPLVVIMLIIFLIIIIAMFDWPTLLKITFFDNIYESVMDLKIGNYMIAKNILGTLSPFGYWSNYELIMFIILCIPFITWLYNLKFDDMIDGFKEGAKQMAKPAFYVLLANVLYAAMFNSQAGENIFYTIMNFFLGISDKFNAFIVAIITLIGGFIYSDFPSFVGTIATPITGTYANANMYPLIGFMIQTLYGLVMFIAPTSMLLIFGLSYFDISYKDWFKTIWKYLVKIILVVIIVTIIIGAFI